MSVTLVAAIVLAGCASVGSRSSNVPSRRGFVATAFLPASSVCGTSGDLVHQSLNGDFTGCFRVPALGGDRLVVALQTFLSGSLGAVDALTTTSVATTSPGDLALSVRPSHVTPGQRVEVTGHFRGRAPTLQQQRAATFSTLCWDGCRTGLQEQASPVHWLSSTTFRMAFAVPQTAWLTSRGGAVVVHPLTSGRYRIGVQCLIQHSGCALGSAEAQTDVTLRAPSPSRCLRGRPCATMTFSTANAAVGEEVHVTGWAPMQLVIGQPFGYFLSVTRTSSTRRFPSISFARGVKGGGFNVVLAPRVLRVLPSPTWASLGRVTSVSSTFSGPSAIDPASNSPLVAWCQPTRIVITGGSRLVVIPISTVRAALRGSPLNILISSPSPQCDEVQLDPTRAATIYAGFTAAEGRSIPPVYLAPLYSTNAGLAWHRVPIPVGASITEFGGFVTEGNSVEALFSSANGSAGARFPVGTNDGVVAAEVTSNGGASWRSTTLGCPLTGPCSRFGPFQWGNCAMNSDPQALLLAPPAASTAVVHWRVSSWVTSVNSCSTQQLVVVSRTELLLFDPSSQYALRRSIDAGQRWTNIALPVKAVNYGPDSIPLGNSLVLTTDGSLFAVIATPSGRREELFRLAPRATKWCQVPGILGATVASAGNVSPLMTRGADLIWSQTRFSASGRASVTRHVEGLGTLRC